MRVLRMQDEGSLTPSALEVAFEAAPDAQLIVSADGAIEHANAAGLRALEVSSLQAARTLRLSDVIAESARDDGQALREAIAAGEASRLTFVLAGQLGGRRCVDVRASGVTFPDGRRSALLVLRESEHIPEAPAAANDMDATRRRNSSEARSAIADSALAQARLAAIVESCNDAIVSKTLEGIVTSWNVGAERLFGYPASEMIGSSIFRIVPPERRDEEGMILARLRQGQRIEHLDTVRLTKDGRRVPISMTVSPVRDIRGVIVGASKVARDISEKHRLEEARERLLEAERFARERAQRDSLVKDEFLATLSHELRTPLAAIQAWGHLLSIGKVKFEEMRQAGEVIERNALVQRRVIEDLLDISRIVSGKIRLEVDLLEPAVVVRAALDTIMPAANAKGIRIITELDESAGRLRADSARLQQVVWNLLSNAVKFTPDGGEVRVTLESVNSRAVRLTVVDTGTGIEPALLPRIFDRFTQGDASPSRAHGGLGLGLAIAKQITALHGGTIRASSPGKGLGATFVLELPRQSVPAREASSANMAARWASEVPEPGEADLSGVRVLVVDDEPDTRELLERILRDSGAHVVVAESASAAIAVVDERAPDVLVSDIGMPGMDGYELLRRIRSRDDEAKSLPAIALTAFARPKDRLNALRAGYVAHLTKPAEPAQLIATVAAAAGRIAR